MPARQGDLPCETRLRNYEIDDPLPRPRRPRADSSGFPGLHGLQRNRRHGRGRLCAEQPGRARSRRRSPPVRSRFRRPDLHRRAAVRHDAGDQCRRQCQLQLQRILQAGTSRIRRSGHRSHQGFPQRHRHHQDRGGDDQRTDGHHGVSPRALQSERNSLFSRSASADSGCSSVGRVRVWGTCGRWFESSHPDL